MEIDGVNDEFGVGESKQGQGRGEWLLGVRKSNMIQRQEEITHGGSENDKPTVKCFCYSSSLLSLSFNQETKCLLSKL